MYVCNKKQIAKSIKKKKSLEREEAEKKKPICTSIGLCSVQICDLTDRV